MGKFISAITIIVLCLVASGCMFFENKEEYKETQDMMDTFVTITIYANNPEDADKVFDEAFAEIERIEREFSIYDKESQAYNLNRFGYVEDASQEFLDLINNSKRYHKLSKGAFDITVQPIIDLYTKSFQLTKNPPTEKNITETLNFVGSEKIIVENNKVSFKEKDMKITLGGIAKGYAIDKAVKSLKNNGIDSALVNAGGDMRALGSKPLIEEEWNIALQNPRNPDNYVASFSISDKAVATSGDYERYYDPEMKAHHIVNPKTGYSATGLISVTIIAPTATQADALSTSVFVMGKDEGLKLIEALDNTEALVITSDKELIYSSGFPR